MKTIYEQWRDKEIGNFGSFHTALLRAYSLADGANRGKLETAFPEWFTLAVQYPDYNTTGAQEMFTRALSAGHLSPEKNAANYVGLFMFMGLNQGYAMFKHIDTRSYFNWLIK